MITSHATILPETPHPGQVYLVTCLLLVDARPNVIASCRACLRSTSTQQYEVPQTALKFGERAFSFASPAAALTPNTTSTQSIGHLYFHKNSSKLIFLTRRRPTLKTVTVKRRWSLLHGVNSAV